MSEVTQIGEALDLSARQGVPRALVHRAAIAEVFITAGFQLDERHFQCSAQIPKTNLYFNDISSRRASYDLMSLMEIFRQASIYVSHEFIGVTSDQCFLYVGSDTKITSFEQLEVGSSPATATIEVRVVDEYRRRGVLQGVTLDMLLLLDGKIAARHTGMSIQWMSKDVWTRIREKALARLPDGVNSRCPVVAPVAANLVGRTHSSNVVVGKNIVVDENHLRTELLIPFDNGAIFDHPLDHIPGMLLMEASRQSAMVAMTRFLDFRPRDHTTEGCKIEFDQFGEFGVTTYCLVPRAKIRFDESTGRVFCEDIIMEQSGVAIARADLTFSVGD